MPLPENTIKITGLNAGTVKGGSLLATSEPDSSTPPVYSSSKVSAADIADFVANDKNYVELTETSDKTLVGAINEIAQGGGGGGSSTLAGLTDVDITTPTDGQVLSYDSVNQEWVNADVGDASKVELTQAEYDALEQAGEIDPTVMYFITDGQSGNEIIDDTTTSANKVWSSQKTDTEIQAVASVVATKQDDLSCGQLTNVDLNDYKDNGFYWVTQTNVSNKPATNFGYLIVAHPSTVIQIFICHANDTTVTRGDMYVRFYANNQWYGWNKIASSRPEPVKATRTGLTIAAGTTSYFTFSGIPVKTGYTRMVTCANPSEGGLYYLRTVENGNDLRVYINNALGASVTFDLTIMVEYIAT